MPPIARFLSLFPRSSAPFALGFAALMAGCAMHLRTPRAPPTGPDAGLMPADFDRAIACGNWRWASDVEEARSHRSFPETSPRGCFAEVHHRLGVARIFDEVVPSCQAAIAPERRLARRADYERAIAPRPGDRVPLELACELPLEVRNAAARANAETLARAPTIDETPYLAIGIPGYGSSAQNESALVGVLPDSPCRPLPPEELERLSVNVIRAERAGEAFRGGVAPYVIASGGAIHGRVVEAFMLGHLLACRYGVPRDRILYDPCADHTHTNLRNIGAMISGLGGSRAYLVTDDFLQGDYLQDYSGFEHLGGSLDERSLRDFGYLIGAWRQASRGMDAGFWYSPHRFWGERDKEKREFLCVGDAPVEGDL